MSSIKKILCTVDLSDFNPDVPKRAIDAAKAYGADIAVVYASPPLTQYAAFEIQPQAIAMFTGEISAGAEKMLSKVVEEHFPGLKVESEVLTGIPDEVILEKAKSLKADLIVMGTHGRKGYDRFLLGSVAAKVVKKSNIPVLTIPVSEK